MRRVPVFAFLLSVTTLLLAGCASRPNVDYDQTFDFAIVRTFNILSPAETQSGDPRIDSPLINERIHAAIAAVLAGQGYRAVSETPDIAVRYQVGKRSGVESRGSGVSMGVGTYRRGSGAAIGYGFPANDITSYEEGILTIDIMNAADNKLVWRGSSSRRLNDHGTTPEATTKAVNEVVAEILQQFPPGHGKQ
jgi:hypothetical protein